MAEFASRVLHPNDLFALEYVHDARLSPDGRRVAYVISRTMEKTGEEPFEIWIAELATGELCKLTFPGNATCPRWSPDGEHLAFIGLKGDVHRH
jgi:dipeptidyl aminopeptidase/acylaminoacyl peptidase